MKILVFGVIVLSAAFAGAQDASLIPADTERLLIEQTKAVPAAQKSKSYDVLDHLLADGFAMVGSEGKPHGRGELIGEAGELEDFTVYDIKLIPLNVETALVSYNSIVKEPEGDTGLAPRYQRITDVWVRQGSDWKLKFQQSTPLRPID
jgi:hypothetical protein